MKSIITDVIMPPAGRRLLMGVLKVTTVGNSVGVILPKELLERLRVGKGDNLYVVETKNGIELTPYNPEFARQMEAAERVMREDRDALRKLAE
jgi:putative addiction module antidote